MFGECRSTSNLFSLHILTYPLWLPIAFGFSKDDIIQVCLSIWYIFSLSPTYLKETDFQLKKSKGS